MKNILKVFCCGLFFAAVVGCSSVNTVENADFGSGAKMVSDKRIITDDGLDDIAYIAGVNDSNSSAGLLKIQVELVNRTQSARNFNYCFEWFDGDGMLIASPEPIWITSSIDAGESKYVSAVAPSAKARDFRLKLLGNVRGN